MVERNPKIFLGTPITTKTRACPLCGHTEYNGLRLGGVVTYTCLKKECGNKWQGGLPREIVPDSIALPPVDDKTPITVQKGRDGRTTEEIRKAQPLTADFRRGSLVPSEE